MIDITLKGILGKSLGEKWRLNVSSVLEIFEAIEANTLKISKHYKNLSKFSLHFIILVDGKPLSAHLINAKILKDGQKVKILPVVQGGWVMFVIGMILMVLSMVLLKALSPDKPRDVRTNSYILGNIRNTTSNNIPVPIGYGRFKVGSAVVSNSLEIAYAKMNEQKTSNGFSESSGMTVYRPLEIGDK